MKLLIVLILALVFMFVIPWLLDQVPEPRENRHSVGGRYPEETPRSLITRKDWEDAMADLGLRVSFIEHCAHGILTLRTAPETGKLLARWLLARKPIAIGVIVRDDLRWWECRITRIKWRMS